MMAARNMHVGSHKAGNEQAGPKNKFSVDSSCVFNFKQPF